LFISIKNSLPATRKSTRVFAAKKYIRFELEPIDRILMIFAQ
jgi:hypothetical protein